MSAKVETAPAVDAAETVRADIKRRLVAARKRSGDAERALEERRKQLTTARAERTSKDALGLLSELIAVAQAQMLFELGIVRAYENILNGRRAFYVAQ